MTTEQPEVTVAIEPVFLDKQTTCSLLGGISEDKLDEFLRAGDITAKTIGKRVVFTPEEVRRFASERPAWAPRRSA